MAKRRKKKSKKRSKGKSAGTLVVASKVREYVRSKNFRVAGDFIDKLSDEIEAILDTAIDRADDNGRATIRGSDL